MLPHTVEFFSSMKLSLRRPFHSSYDKTLLITVATCHFYLNSTIHAFWNLAPLITFASETDTQNGRRAPRSLLTP